MAYSSTGQWQFEDASVGRQLTGLLSKNNPLMQQARTGARQTANKRGLMNSSMALQAGEQAARNVALPIAQQQAQQIHQNNQRATDIGSREKIATMNVQAHDRQYAANATTEMQKKYAAAWAEVIKNKDIDAKARSNYFTHLTATRNSDMRLIEQLYNIDLTW